MRPEHGSVKRKDGKEAASPDYYNYVDSRPGSGGPMSPQEKCSSENDYVISYGFIV
jgi:hypothetical protein